MRSLSSRKSRSQVSKPPQNLFLIAIMRSSPDHRSSIPVKLCVSLSPNPDTNPNPSPALTLPRIPKVYRRHRQGRSINVPFPFGPSRDQGATVPLSTSISTSIPLFWSCKGDPTDIQHEGFTDEEGWETCIADDIGINPGSAICESKRAAQKARGNHGSCGCSCSRRWSSATA